MAGGNNSRPKPTPKPAPNVDKVFREIEESHRDTPPDEPSHVRLP